MNFQEAEARFRWIESQRAAGRMDEGTYRNELNALRVVDAWGRHWMPQERTGVWHMYDGRQWVPAAPPVQPAYPPPAAQGPGYASQYGQPVQPPAFAPQYPQPVQQSAQAYPPQYAQPVPQPVQAYSPQYAQPAQAQAGGSSCLKWVLYLVLWAVIWAVIGAVVYFLLAPDQPEALLGVALAAVLSAVLMLFALAGNWQGQVVEIKAERVRIEDSDGDVRHENQTFAYIRQPNGRIRKERAMPQWKVGDRLEKRRGEMHIRVVG